MPANQYPALSARNDGALWRVTPSTATESGLGEADRALAEAAINDLLARQEARLAPFHLAWRQELPITTYREHATAFVLGEEFAARCLAGPERTHVVSALPGELSRFAVECALERGGARVAGRWRRGPLLAVATFLATLGALAGLVYMLALAARWPKLRAAGGGGTVVALHAEEANRTRHVRRVLGERSPQDTQVVFVGRLHIGLTAARAMLARAGWHHGFALVWDWQAALASLPHALRMARQGPAAMVAAGYRPPFRQLVSIILRIFLGAASAWRWQRVPDAPARVVFGHTGRADTVLPEAAVQDRGTLTAHWMHGVSVGHGYQGISDLCLVLCGHDARWHDATLGYRRNMALTLPQPAFRSGSKPGWVVMTNMTHYGYTYFPSIGPAHELRLIELVEELARRDGTPPTSVTWKPHPVFYTSDPATRELVGQRLTQAGFALWPSETMPFEEAAAYETVIVTPSGVALDMLKAGRLPVLAEFQPIDPAHVLAHLAPRGSDIASLSDAIAAARDPDRAPAMFDSVWNLAQPGEAGSLDDIERLLAGAASRQPGRSASWL